MVRSEIGGQKAKSQIPDLFPDMEFPNLFHLKEHKILMNLKKKVILLPIRGAEESTKTFWATWINSKQFFKNGPNLSQCLFVLSQFLCPYMVIGQNNFYYFYFPAPLILRCYYDL